LIFFKAWVIKLYWGWFLVPLEVKPIGILHAFGFIYMYSLLSRSAVESEAAKDILKSPEKMFDAVSDNILGTSLAWICGYCTHFIMIHTQ
jgi:hypothetical protein